MEKKIGTSKKAVKIAIWVAAIIILMVSIHITVNYLDFPGVLGFLKALHGG